MKAHEELLTRFLDGSNKRFVIPVYQRPYSWNKANCELLLKDLKELFSKKQDNHFFGGIVHIAKNASDNEMIIVDGQQRITTISLLLLAIRNCVLDRKLSSSMFIVDEFYYSFLSDRYREEGKLKLRLSSSDNEAYDRLFNNKERVRNNQITVNYEIFYSKLSQMSIQDIEAIFSGIKKLMIINVSLYTSHGDDPQLIFESLNSAGLGLTESDKIRNYILMGINSKMQDKIYLDYWLKVEEKAGGYLDKFIRHYLAVKMREIPNEGNLYFAFKEYRQKNNALSIDEIMQEVLKYAKYYENIKNATASDGYFSIIKRLNFLEINTIYPLLMDLLDAKAKELIANDDLISALNALESFIARRTFCNMAVGALNKLFTSIGAEVEKLMKNHSISYIDALIHSIVSKTKNSRFPIDSEFEENFEMFELYNAKSATRKYVLERLENFENKERIDVNNLIEEGTLTIEHVMPQSLTKEWKEMLGSNWEIAHAKWKDRIGNLTLSAYNSDYSNLSFDKKKTMAAKGFEFSKLYLNDFIKKQPCWTEDQILERSKLLFRKAVKIWPFPKANFQIKSEEDWVCLDDELDFTNKAIIKYMFLGDEIATKDITDAYRKILMTLYEFDKVALSSATSRYFGKKKDVYRSEFDIDKEFFIEQNLSSQGKVDVLREAFDILKIDYSEMKFLIKEKQTVKAFDVNDESTYENCKIGELAKGLISNLIVSGKIDDEIINLMDKDCSTITFGMYYPTIAENREIGTTKGKPQRYYKTPVEYKGKKYYITTEWFEEFRAKLMTWYNRHNI